MKKRLKEQDPGVQEVFNHIKSLANGKNIHVDIFTAIYDKIDLRDWQLDTLEDLCHMADGTQSEIDPYHPNYYLTGRTGPKGTIRKENSSLASYLAKRLTVSVKEAQLIENVVKSYIRKRR